MYYCQSRYYVPEWCRWLTPDSIEYLEPDNINGLNLYCYCMNDPVNNVDPSGHFAITLSVILWAAAIGAEVGATSQFATDVICNGLEHGFDFSKWEFSSWQSYVGATIGGAAGGVVSLFAGPVASAFVDGFISSSSSMVLENVTGASNYSFGEIFTTSLLIGGFSSVTAGLCEGVTMSPKDMIENFGKYTSKTVKSKVNIFKQSILNALPYSFINSFYNGLVVSPYQV